MRASPAAKVPWVYLKILSLKSFGNLNVLLPKLAFKMSLAAECRELLQRLKNLTFEVEESSAELKELHKT